MAKVYHFLEMWQGRQKLCTTQKESRTQNKQLTAVGYIDNTEEIVKASWSLFQPHGAAAFKLPERSSLPPALAAKDLPRGRTQTLDVSRMRIINRHPVECEEHSVPESIEDTENRVKCDGPLHNLNDSKDNCTADVESYIVKDNTVEDLVYLEQQDVCITPNVPGLIWPTQKWERQAEKVLVMVNAIEMRRNTGVKKQ